MHLNQPPFLSSFTLAWCYFVQVRLWAPQKSTGSDFGSLIDNKGGWGSTSTAYEDSGYVRVQAWGTTYSTADFDSGWFYFSSQNTTKSFTTVPHNLNVVPGRVKVLVQAINGANEGYIFHGVGSAHSDDTTGLPYGGVVFSYNATVVNLWAPTKNTGGTTGSIINVIHGWGGETNAQA